MADYVRRQIAPLLPGLGAEYLELMVGELEIATETRHEFSRTDADDLAAAIVDILYAAAYATNRAAAKAYCDKIFLSLNLHGSQETTPRAMGLCSIDRPDSALGTNTDALRGTDVQAASGDQHDLSKQPASTAALGGATCAHPASLATIAALMIIIARSF